MALFIITQGECIDMIYCILFSILFLTLSFVNYLIERCTKKGICKATFIGAIIGALFDLLFIL